MGFTERICSLFDTFTARAPLIQCITNTVVQQYTANVLLAAGASPAMVDHESDAADFAAVADGLLINFGTPTSHHYLAADAASAVFNAAGKPWVLDPVGLGVGALRTDRIRATVAAGPTLIRGNASEIIAVGGAGAGARGTDAIDTVDDAIPAAEALAAQGLIAAVSGETDQIVFGTEPARIEISGGSAMMTQVIGNGCALGALSAAYLAAAEPEDYGVAVAAAHAHFTAAATLASQHPSVEGPGSFSVAFLDGLHQVNHDHLEQVGIRYVAAHKVG